MNHNRPIQTKNALPPELAALVEKKQRADNAVNLHGEGTNLHDDVKEASRSYPNSQNLRVRQGKKPTSLRCPRCGSVCEYTSREDIAAKHLPEKLALRPLWERDLCQCEKDRASKLETRTLPPWAKSEVAISRSTLLARLRRESGLQGRQLLQEFCIFDTTRSEDMAAVHAQFQEIAQMLAEGQPVPSVGLYSAPESCGCGKSHLCASLALEAIQSGKRVYFTTLIDWLDAIRATYRTMDALERTRQEDSDPMHRAIMADVLILDDLGSEEILHGERGAFVRRVLMKLFDARYLHSRPTFATSNIPPSVWLDNIGEPAASRIASRWNCQWWEVSGPDGRRYQPEVL